MKKSVQMELVLILFVLEMLILIATGSFYVTQLHKIGDIIQNQVIENDIQTKIEQIKIILIITSVLCGMIAIVIAIFITKVMVEPISELNKGVKDIADGKDIDLKQINNKAKNGQVKELIETFEIITNRFKENLKEVEEKRKQIQTILQHMTEGIIVFNKEGEITNINPAAKSLLNIKNEEDFETIIKRLNIDINIEKIMYLENWTSTSEKIKINMDGRFLNIYFELLKDEQNENTGLMVVVKDVTENEKLDTMRREFVADVSHELKTPITSIRGYAETLLEGNYDEETKTFLNVISTEATRMGKLVTDLLELSKFDNKKKKINVTYFDMAEMVNNCQQKLKIEIKKKKHHVEIFSEAELPKVKADEESIERVILNILQNSIRYTAEKGEIKIYIGCIYNDVYVKITDNGGRRSRGWQ